MKIWTKLIILFLLITNTIFIFTTVMYKNSNPVLKVYSFNGKNGDIKISNGVIILTKDKHIVQGGQLQYLGNKIENIESYTKTIYIDNRGNKEPLVVTSVSSNTENGMVFPDELLLNENLGDISGGKLLIEDGKSIKDNLYFSLEGFTNEGKSFNFEVKLQVKELN